MGAEDKPKPITSFRGEYGFLSNFWPVNIQHEGLCYPSVEHAYQACKLPNPAHRHRFTRREMRAADAKRLGRQLSLRPGWDLIRIPVMHSLLILKFEHPELAEALLATRGRDLVEVNTWNDKYWGCVTVNGELVGENHLGKSLMLIRDSIEVVRRRRRA